MTCGRSSTWKYWIQHVDNAREVLIMQRVTVAMFVALCVLFVASSSFAANEFQVKGTVSRIDGNLTTIKDDKGREIIIEGTMTDVKVGDPVLLKGQVFNMKSLPVRPLTAADKGFMAGQCQVPQMDIDVIPQLGRMAQGYIVQWIDAKDCRKFVPYKNTRNYYRRLDINKPIPLPPAGWNGRWLTEQEFKNYVHILENAPW